eukprot:jgi/Mesvir1/117/Mv26430-RA.1
MPPLPVSPPDHDPSVSLFRSASAPWVYLRKKLFGRPKDALDAYLDGRPELKLKKLLDRLRRRSWSGSSCHELKSTKPHELETRTARQCFSLDAPSSTEECSSIPPQNLDSHGSRAWIIMQQSTRNFMQIEEAGACASATEPADSLDSTLAAPEGEHVWCTTFDGETSTTPPAPLPPALVRRVWTISCPRAHLVDQCRDEPAECASPLYFPGDERRASAGIGPFSQRARSSSDIRPPFSPVASSPSSVSRQPSLHLERMLPHSLAKLFPAQCDDHSSLEGSYAYQLPSPHSPGTKREWWEVKNDMLRSVVLFAGGAGAGRSEQSLDMPEGSSCRLVMSGPALSLNRPRRRYTGEFPRSPKPPAIPRCQSVGSKLDAST